MSIVAILTGKGGSKLKDKNILKINGKPCLYYPCKAAKKVKIIKHYFATSEDSKILKYAKKYGYSLIKRPKSLSKINSQHIDVIKHSLNEMSKFNINPEIIVILLANAPIVHSDWIKDSINILLKNKRATSVVPVVKNNDQHPMRAKKIKKGYLEPHFKINPSISTNRQDLVSNYFLCHNFWVIKTKNIYLNNGQPPWKFLGKKVMPYIINKSIDIHEKEDLFIAQKIMRK
jgi:CMP-N,N'-diacetyllegionaminic acid synthase